MDRGGRAAAPVRAAQARRVLAVLAVLLAIVAAAVFFVGGGWSLLHASGGRWKLGALGSRLFVTCGLITAGCVLGLAVLGTALWLAGASRRARRDGEEGTAIIEFALVLPIALMLVLIMTQSSLLMGGNLCVNYAAFCAARSAVVSVPLDFGEDEPRNVVSDMVSSAKLRRMDLAAAWALLPVGCSNPRAPSQDVSLLQSGLERFFGSAGIDTPHWLYSNLGQRLRYAEDYTQMELAPPANGTEYAPNEDLRVNLRHDFYLSVPYAAYIFSQLARDGVRLGFGASEYATVIRATCTLTNEGAQDYVDVEQFPHPRSRR